jgi:hypothetical protein
MWWWQEPVPPKAIMAVLTDRRLTRSQRVALSKSLLRLCARGLVQAYTTEVCRQGKGYIYALSPPPDGQSGGIATGVAKESQDK